MIQHQAEGRGKERLGPVGSGREWVGGAHAGGEEGCSDAGETAAPPALLPTWFRTASVGRGLPVF